MTASVRAIYTAPRDCPSCGRGMYYSTAAGGHVHDATGDLMCPSTRQVLSDTLRRQALRDHLDHHHEPVIWCSDCDSGPAETPSTVALLKAIRRREGRELYEVRHLQLVVSNTEREDHA